MSQAPLPMAPGMRCAAARSFEEWRSAVRELLAHDVAPHAVQWTTGAGSADLFPLPEPAAETALQAAGESAKTPHGLCSPLHLPRKMVEMLQTAACFRAADRWAFLYRVVWRWRNGEQDVLSAADEDGKRLHAMVKAVHREEHDMHAYVRFRERPAGAEPPRFVAWYEPAHEVLPRVARHFARRMGNTSWMIATPDATVLWNGAELRYAGALLQGAADIDDAGESLWLTYYRSIFNPARLNTRVMQSHIPSRFWKNLPEGALVPAMVAEASAGARRHGQAQPVGLRSGAVIPITPERAQPLRPVPAMLEECRRCQLWRTATQAVEGSGPGDARIMLVGEQPGDLEDLAGEPFVGPAGQLLDRVIEQSGLSRRELYLTNAVKHFKWEPRGKRRLHKTPAQEELAACRHWLQEELASVRPEVVVALGGTALKSLLGRNAPKLTDLIGKPFRHDGYWIVASYHPAYVLRTPDEQSKQNATDVMADALRQARLLAGQHD